MLGTKHHSIIAAAALSATRPEKSNCARVHGKGGKGTTGITRKGLLGLSGLWVICLVLGAPMARAATVVARAATAGGYYSLCAQGTITSGGPGLASASTGTVPCTDIGGNATSDSASGSLLTGNLSAAATVSTTVDSGYGANPTANVTLQDFGIITLPTGMSSASVTFGASGVSATASASVPLSGGANSLVGMTLDMWDSSTASGPSYSGCLAAPVLAGCSGVDASPRVTGTVYNGETLELMVEASVSAYAFSGGIAGANIAVDPLYLDLPAGVTFSSYTDVPGFLSGPTQTPIPSSFLLLGTGLLGLAGLFRRRLAGFRHV